MEKKEKAYGIFIRLDKKTLKKVEESAKYETIDKTEWARRAILDYLDCVEEEEDNYSIERYINGRIAEEEILNLMGWSKIPKDLKEARVRVINAITEKAIKDGGKKE